MESRKIERMRLRPQAVCLPSEVTKQSKVSEGRISLFNLLKIPRKRCSPQAGNIQIPSFQRHVERNTNEAPEANGFRDLLFLAKQS